MKNKKDFRQFRVQILLRTFGALTAAAAVIYITYSVLQHVGLADGMVAFFQFVFGINYEAALQLYERIFRRHMDMMILCSFLLVFAGLFWLYLRWLTGYLEAVSRGMDILLEDDPKDISDILDISDVLDVPGRFPCLRSCSPLSGK